MEISQRDFERLMENWANGSPSPFYKRKDRLLGNEPIAVATFAGEKVRWVGKVDTDMFSTRQNKDFGVYVGVSPLRAVFYRAASVFSDLCRSYWFEVDTEGRTWQRGKVRKRECTGIGLARPRFKKGLVGRQIVLAGRLIRTDGKEDTIFEHELEGLDWLNPATGKFEGRKGQQLYDQLMEAYENRIPISVDDLWLMENDTRRAIVTAPGGAAMAPREPEQAPPMETPARVAQASAAEEQTQEVPVSMSVGADEEESVLCPACGNALRAGVRFCGKCGHGLDSGEAEMPQAEVAGRERAGDECPECGHSFEPGTLFCGRCGHRLGEEVEEPTEVRVEEPVLGEGARAEPLPGEVPPRTCPECGKSIEEDWRACPHCGARLATQCPSCGRATEPDWVACPYCGKVLKDD
jgi:predicted amidophosphoribosyltransferase